MSWLIIICISAAAAKLKLLLSFAVGGLLGDVFLHLLPEAWAHLDKGMYILFHGKANVSFNYHRTVM